MRNYFTNLLTANHYSPITIIFLLFAICLSSCQQDTPPAQLLVTEGFTNKTQFLRPSSSFKIKFNQRVTAKTTGGSALQSVDDSLTYTAPTTAGSYLMVVNSYQNPQDSMKVTVIVSQQAAIFRELQRGGYALIFRHAAADVGADQFASTDPKWFKSCDSKLARQLNDQGKNDAQKIGKVFKTGQIPIARLLSSEFCRCYTTADLMDLGITNQQNKDLTYWVYDESNRYPKTMNVANSQPIDDKNSVLIIHAGFAGNIPTPAPLTALNWGDAAVFKLKPNQTADYITTLKLTDFTELIK